MLVFGSLGTKRDGGIEEVFCNAPTGRARLSSSSSRPRARALASELAGRFGGVLVHHVPGSSTNYDTWVYTLKRKEVEPLVVINESAQLSTQFRRT